MSPRDLIPSGALLVHALHSKQTEVEVGIVFNPSIQSRFELIETTPFADWDLSLTQSFAVATEEVSHFRYFVFHSEHNRPVTELELEFQGELDKFLLFYFLSISETKSETDCFESLFSKLFEDFSLLKHLPTEKKDRYLFANQLAKEFFQKRRHYFKSPEHYSELLKELRVLYRLSSEDKFSLKNRL